MKKRWNRVTAAALTGAMLVSLGGCMPTQNDAAKAPETTTAGAAQATTAPVEITVAAASGMTVNTTDPITLRMNWWGGDSRHQATLEAIKAFEAKYPNIKVEAEYEAFTGHEEKVALALKSGSAADVIQLNMDWLFNYSPNATMFVDMNTVSDIIDLTAYDQSDLDFFTTNGVLQALPVSNTGRVFYWNKTTFDKIGAKYPTNLDELYAVGEQFAAYEDGSYYPLCVKELDRMIMMVYYLQCKYGKPWVENYELQYTKEEITDGLEWISLLEEKHVIPSLEVLAGDGSELIDTNQKWIEGKYAGIYMWDSNLKKHAEALADGECEIGEFIDMGDYHGGMTKASMVFAIPASSEHPAEAAALIQFLMGDAEGAEILGDSRGVPANKNGLAALDLSDSVAAQANAIVAEWSRFKFDPVFERAALKNADGTYFLVMQMLSYGEADAAACADQLMTGINNEIAAAQK